MLETTLSKADEISQMLSCIAHPIRLLIICMLLERSMFVNELTDALGTTKGNISQHLRVLVDRGLLGRRRDGNRIFYRIRDPNLTELIGTIKRLYCPDFNIS